LALFRKTTHRGGAEEDAEEDEKERHFGRTRWQSEVFSWQRAVLLEIEGRIVVAGGALGTPVGYLPLELLVLFR